jgi:hypothetical protein
MADEVIPEPTLDIVGFRSGCLYVHADGDLMRVTPWPEVLLESREAAGAWRPLGPDLQTDWLPLIPCQERIYEYAGHDVWREPDGQEVVGFGLAAGERRLAWAGCMVERYLAGIPPLIQAHLRQPDRRSFGLLHLLARVPEAADYLAHDPNLALILADHRRDWPALRHASWDEIRMRVRGRRTALLGWLGLPAKESTRSLLRKLSPADLRHLPSAAPALLDQNVVHTLLNASGGTAAGLRLSSCAPLRPLISSALLQRMERHWWLWAMLDLHWPTLMALAERGVLRFQSRHDFISLVEGSQSRIMTASDAAIDAPFPEPPFIAGPEVEPIVSVHALIREGQEMNHCAGSLNYIAGVLAGQVYFYKVLRPVRATLLLSWQHGAWWFGAMLGYDNELLSLRAMHTALRSFPASSRIEGLAC